MTKSVKGVLAVFGLTLLLSACTPAQWKSWLESKGVDTSSMSQQQLDQGAQVATAVWAKIIADAAVDAELHKYDYVLSDDALARLRQCESGGNYAITDPSGTYRGAYQFDRTTWNSVAGRHFPKYVGVDPAGAAPLVQDAMARALYMERGRQPWPICGYRI
ncbi:MAG: transglycosylase family protein [Acidimicrobiales bacterium]